MATDGNQPALLAAISAALPPAAPGGDHHVETDRGNGKIVRRAIWVAPTNRIEFPGAAQVFRIRRSPFDHAGNRLSKEIVRQQPDRHSTRPAAGRWFRPPTLGN